MPGWDADRLRAALRVYLLADAGLVPPDRLPEIVSAALRGGVTAVQLRAKSATTLELLELARNLNAICREAAVPFIVNDRIDVALAAEADGAHVGHIGEEDLSPHDARRLLGSDAIVGVSVGTPRAAPALDALADTAGAGRGTGGIRRGVCRIETGRRAVHPHVPAGRHTSASHAHGAACRDVRADGRLGHLRADGGAKTPDIDTGADASSFRPGRAGRSPLERLRRGPD